MEDKIKIKEKSETIKKFPELEDLMFKNKNAIKSHNKKKYFKNKKNEQI